MNKNNDLLLKKVDLTLRDSSSFAASDSSPKCSRCVMVSDLSRTPNLAGKLRKKSLLCSILEFLKVHILPVYSRHCIHCNNLRLCRKPSSTLSLLAMLSMKYKSIQGHNISYNYFIMSWEGFLSNLESVLTFAAE